MTAAVRAAARKRQRRGPSPEAVIGQAIARPTIPPSEDARPSVLYRLVDAVKPEDDREATLVLGLVLLGIAGAGISGSVFVGLLPAGIVLTVVALLAYLRPRGAA